MDFDLTTARSLPQHPVSKRANSLMCDLFRGLGKDVEIGTRMPSLFREAGVGLPDGCDAWSHIWPNEGGGGMVRAVLAGLRKASLAAKLVDASTLDELDSELASIAPDQYLVRAPDMVATWRRKSD
jgi:hypothetical protein